MRKLLRLAAVNVGRSADKRQTAPVGQRMIGEKRRFQTFGKADCAEETVSCGLLGAADEFVSRKVAEGAGFLIGDADGRRFLLGDVSARQQLCA